MGVDGSQLHKADQDENSVAPDRSADKPLPDHQSASFSLCLFKSLQTHSLDLLRLSSASSALQRGNGGQDVFRVHPLVNSSRFMFVTLSQQE